MPRSRRGTSKEVEIRTTRGDARCDVAHGGAALGSVTTPGSLRLPRSGEAIDLACAKAGYEDARVTVDSGTNAGFWSNFYWLPSFARMIVAAHPRQSAISGRDTGGA